MPEGATTEQIAEKHIVLTLQMNDVQTNYDFQNEFNVWKSRQPITASKDNSEGEEKRIKNTPDSKDVSHKTLFTVAQDILSFPVESKSPIDCMLFLSEIKRDLALII